MSLHVNSIRFADAKQINLRSNVLIIDATLKEASNLKEACGTSLEHHEKEALLHGGVFVQVRPDKTKIFEARDGRLYSVCLVSVTNLSDCLEPALSAAK